MGLCGVRGKCYDMVTVVAAKAFRCSDPDKALFILNDLFCVVRGQSFIRCYPVEMEIWLLRCQFWYSNQKNGDDEQPAFHTCSFAAKVIIFRLNKGLYHSNGYRPGNRGAVRCLTSKYLSNLCK